jgi:catechol 2,3-dioxygenase-like lactoylglutathione lyase family enzyme
MTENAADRAPSNVRVRFEHVGLNVPEPAEMAQWYADHLGLRIVRRGEPPTNARFVADADGNMMLEFYTNPPDNVPDYAATDPLLLHVAFMVDDVAVVRDRLLAAGATAVGDVIVTPTGDRIAMLRDPWGLAIQFVERAEPMLTD